jgi:hypothetical protein
MNHLGIYFWSHSGSFVGRAGQVSILQDRAGDQSGPMLLAQDFVETAGVFGVIGDNNLRHNPASRPAFDLLLSAWLVPGIVLVIVRRQLLPYLLALLWLAMMALPALFSDWASHTLRMLGVVPAACLSAVPAMVGAGRRLGGVLRRWQG